MMMLVRRLLACMIFISINTVFASKCRFPIDVPAILSIDRHAEATTSGEKRDYGCTVTFSGEYPLVDADWWYARTRAGITTFLPVGDTNHGVGVSKTMTTTRGRHRVSFHADQMVTAVSVTVTFNLGCTHLYETLQILLNSNKSFIALPSTTLINMPQPEMIYERGKPLEFQLAVESSSDGITPIIYSYLYRNQSDAMISYEGDQALPFSLARVLTRQQTKGGEVETWSLQLTINRDLKDITIRVGVERDDLNGLLANFEAGYYVAFHTGEKTAPVYDIRQCYHNQITPPSIDHDGVVVLLQQAGRPACLHIIVDGNPLPEVALAEVRNDGRHVVRTLRSSVYGRLSAIQYDGWFYMDILQEGEILDYIMVASDRHVFLTKMIRIESYAPPRVGVPDNKVDLTDAPKQLILECSPGGEYTSVGVYYGDESYYDTSNWNELAVSYAPSSDRNKVLTFHVYINATVLSELNPLFINRLFCGVKTRFPSLFVTAPYNVKFNVQQFDTTLNASRYSI